MSQALEGLASIDFREREGAGAGYTVLKLGPRPGDLWRLAWCGEDPVAAEAAYGTLARQTVWGAVRFLDPVGRELAFHLGKAQWR